MLDILHSVERQMPALLAEQTAWKSVWIDYEKPYVERLWRPFGEYRIYLHHIHPCESHEALFHPHPWPSAMRIISGSYEMAIGFGEGTDPPAVSKIECMHAGDEYEMVDQNDWHSVRPLQWHSVQSLQESVRTLMVTGKPWGRSAPKSAKPFATLSDEVRSELFAAFEQYYAVTQ